VRENPGVDRSAICWLVVGAGAAVLWSCVGIERTRMAMLRRRLSLGSGIIVVGLASFAVTGSSPGSAAGAQRVADAFTRARLTQGARAAKRYLAPDAAPLAVQLPARPSATEAEARRVVGSGVSLECGRSPILQSGSRNERCVRYGDGSGVFLVRRDGTWLVVGFTLG
jgi:hypothetical protein